MMPPLMMRQVLFGAIIICKSCFPKVHRFLLLRFRLGASARIASRGNVSGFGKVTWRVMSVCLHLFATEVLSMEGRCSI